MKLLESIALVQFFLYEREDLVIGRNTAFLGPNGTGKTALLDALQTVMLAADSNRTHFNASGEGKKRARSLREYCLGVYGQTNDARCRSTSNTYINLVFRDEDTGTAVTAGVSLSASADSPDVVFNGLYILPGIALTTAAHMERESGRDVVQPWRSFQHVAADMCRMQSTATTPYFTTNREEFTRRLLLEHLAAPGDRPNVQSLRSAFARSLKLNQDVNDLSETLRQHLIEPKPTKVHEFRARLDQFREVRDLIKVLKLRIERGGEVVDKYTVVQRERTSEANLECLRAVYHAERVGESLGDAEAAIESLTESLSQAQTDLDRAVTEAAVALEARDRAVAALLRDPAHAQQAGHAERLGDVEAELVRRQAGLQNTFKAMRAAVIAGGQIPEMQAHRGAFESAVQQIEDLQRLHESEVAPPTVAITSALRAVAAVHELIRRALADAEVDQTNARAVKRDADMTLDRIGRGLSPLRDNTLALQRVLADAGIVATPICDLVQIGDSAWQPVLEAYLGPHVEALLIPTRDEIKAIDVYRSLKGDQRIYKVKLALPSRTREWHRSGDGKFAAELVTGENRDAMRYLQGELGRTQLVKTSEQLRAGEKAITVEGMVSSGSGVERLKLPKTDELRFGRRDVESMRANADGAVRSALENVNRIGDAVTRLSKAMLDLAPFANVDVGQASLEEQFAGVRLASTTVVELRDALMDTQTPGLVGLQEARRLADKTAVDARERETTGGKLVARLEERLESAKTQLDGLNQQMQLATVQEKTARQHVLYNANEVDRHRSRLDERHGDNWLDKLQACASATQRAKVTAENADKEAWSLFTLYVTDYHLKNHDIAAQDWARAFGYILADRTRLQDLELAEQEEKSERAYEAAVKVFRTDVAQALLAGFDRIDEQMEGLNKVLKSAPAFSNDEHYQFRSKAVDQHRALYDFLNRVRTSGSDEEDIFGGAGQVPDEFRALVDGDGNSELLSETSPLNDHRRFFSYDVEIFQDGKSIGWLSKRLGPGSGGEHRTPLYVIFGAALAAAYGKANGRSGGGGIMLLDEAFEKMDPQNVRATADYLNALGLQLIMAGPETDQPKMSSFLNVYYDMARFGSRTIQMTKTVLSDQARDLLKSDNFLSHPDLLASEIDRLRARDLGPGDVAR